MTTATQSGNVLEIYTARGKGKPMESLTRATVTAGRGIEDDRYALGVGAFSKNTSVIRHLSLISSEAIAEVNKTHGSEYHASHTRRNIITEGVDLNQLVGEEFTVGGVSVRGVALCDPCQRPSRLLNLPWVSFNEAFAGNGGLRAEVLTSGVIAVNSAIQTS
jgi:hypothetical protein